MRSQVRDDFDPDTITREARDLGNAQVEVTGHGILARGGMARLSGMGGVSSRARPSVESSSVNAKGRVPIIVNAGLWTLWDVRSLRERGGQPAPGFHDGAVPRPDATGGAFVARGSCGFVTAGNFALCAQRINGRIDTRA